jgi:hypothetical protein
MSPSEEWPELPDLPDLLGDHVAPSARSEPIARATVPVVRGSSSSKALMMLGVVCMVLILAGYVLPWIVVDKGAYGERSYGPLELPFGNLIGIAWTVFLIILAVLGWIRRSRWTLLVGSVCSLMSTVVLATLSWLLHLAPRLMPLWLLPKDARGYVPDISIGSGATVAVVASILLLTWFVLASISRPVGEGTDTAT